MDQRIIHLFDEYTHKPLRRDEFISRLVKLTGSMAAAMSVLPLLEVNYAHAATVPENAPGINGQDITYEGDGTTMKAYLVKPEAAGSAKKGAVLVIHENRGLNPHIRDVTRRVAQAGYIAMAPDALSPFGGTPQNEDEARNQIGQLDAVKNRNSFLKGLDYLAALPECNGNTGCVGFCWGGALSNQLAVHAPNLKAAVAYYGRQPDAAAVPNIRAAVQLHYGGLDERINAGIPAYEAALKAAGVQYELYVYEGAQHAFNNDTAPTRYNKEAAQLAWGRTLRWFETYLGA
ncbi:dienelactone hydrolase family protein [Chitinophaga japonensis]|uniref:Carboxymethylenebutenolidase n=1 Tax=Chitinophaga japonensis TaxID=104662 RepID=A0A562SJA6_CHIJA|nr:dienelactone hydrolase family protein [Chitinophaga japonensis]TWI80916.1 carboxymethylenebutenolidase [Chitinophaga japonensis]